MPPISSALKVTGGEIRLLHGDITQNHADAICNATNSGLLACGAAAQPAGQPAEARRRARADPESDRD